MRTAAQTIKRILQKTPNALLCAVGAVVLLFLFYSVTCRTPLGEIWLPADMDNDEVIYNRQVVAAMAGGVPQGYFGYQEAHAAIGRFGAWGPFLILAYALPGLLVGSSVNTMLWCNILFALVGWVLFARGARLSVWQQLTCGGALACLWWPLRSITGGGTEPLHLALVLTLVGASAALDRKFSRGWFWVAVLAAALETICRPYALLFWAFPLLALRHGGAGKRRGVLCAVLALVSFGVALLSITRLSAAYFSNSMDLTPFTLLVQGKLIGAVAYLLRHIVGFCGDWWAFLAPVLHGDIGYVAQTTLTAALPLPIALACLVYDLRRGRAVRLKVTALACGALVLLAQAGFYTAATLPRHGMLLAVLLVAAITVEDAAPAAVVYLPVMVVLLLPMNFERSSHSTYAPVMGEQIDTVQAALTESWQANGSDDPWDSTLAYAYDDGVFHGYLYAVPAGMGIEFDWNTYLADETQPIYSRYAMVAHGGAAEARLQADGWRVLVSTDDLIVYERPDAAKQE